MLQGYELWLVDRQGRRAFHPAAARNTAEVIHEARTLLEANTALQLIEIDRAGEHLVTVENSQPPPA